MATTGPLGNSSSPFWDPKTIEFVSEREVRMSTVELTRDSDGPGLLQALAEHGLEGELVEHHEYLAVEVVDCDEEQLTHAIEDWIRARELPFVPVRIADCTYVVSPPGG
jgi:hypothetical protein